jgi:competence protein ComEC
VANNRPLPGRLIQTAIRAIRVWRDEDAARIGLWTPVIFGAGAVLYLLLKTEPSPLLAPTGFLGALIASRLVEKVRVVAIAAALICAGFMAADLRAASVDAPILEREISFADVAGRLVAIDEAPKMRRLIIDVASIEKVASTKTPPRIRITWRGKDFAARPGDQIKIRASLSPPPPPASPGGFDFARQLYFQRIGAVGYAVSPPIVVAPEHPAFTGTVRAVIESLRVGLARRITDQAPGDSGAIVAAVVTGKREAISEAAEAAFRDSGLAHLLAISGLHMGLATGLIFFAVRAMLAMIEPIALTQPIKKWAAVAALLSGAAYLLVSGGAWSAQRAFIISSIFFIAIIADRRALSLRNVAIAAFIIILLTPEAVLHPGFQMSFAAVTALISAYEWASARADPLRSFSWTARLRRYVVGIAFTDTIAAAATAPYSLFHFNRTANFGLPANIVSIPVMGFWIMPMAIVALLLTPFGLDGPVWRLAAAGVDVILAMGRWTMALPGAVAVFPQWPPAALGALTIGGLWLCLMKAPWRLGGLLALPVAAAMIAATPHPQLFVSNDGDNVGLVVNTSKKNRTLAVLDARKSRFDAQFWMEQAGINVAAVKPVKLADWVPCDDNGCVIESGDMKVAISKHPSQLDDDCLRADLVVALYPADRQARKACAAQIIDRRDAWADGAHVVNINAKRMRIENAAERRGERPWSRR